MAWKEFLYDHSKKLKDYPKDYTADIETKDIGKKRLKESRNRLADIQERLYAYDKYAVLIVFQAMDAAGKDSTIKQVMQGVNPQGCEVTSFKKPSDEELDHDFLWRCYKALPERGKIGIFNRSYYEEVLITKVHPKVLDYQKLPNIKTSDDIDQDFWKKRFDDINAFEKHLVENGTIVLKFFLNVSKKEQRNRFLSRINDQSKNWKFSMSDMKERNYWDKYQEAYQDILENSSTEHAPWYVIPADHKWFMRMTVSEIIIDKLESLNLQFPKVSDQMLEELEEARKILESEE